MRWIRCFALVVLGIVGAAAEAAAAWQAGLARVNITPTYSMWMSGYVKRTEPSQGKRYDLWAKALLLEDTAGHQALLVTMDLVGIDRQTSREICRRIEQKLSIPRAAIVLSASHTHCGPVVGSNLAAMFDLSETQHRHVERYTEELIGKLVELAKQAKSDLQPVMLQRGQDRVEFAVNRRKNLEAEAPQRRAEGKLVGPVDHDLPVLVVRDSAGRLRAAVFGYACHATAMDDNLWSGDWPGVAQAEIEKRHPGATAMFWAGCGGDQNPFPRRRPEFIDKYGQEAADAVERALQKTQPVLPQLACGYEEVDLSLAELPPRQKLEREAAGKDLESYVGSSSRAATRRAKMLLQEWDRNGGLSSTYPYPVQVWKLGKDLNWIFLGGEVVVDYALRFKQELGAEKTWVTAYSNDVMAYIPSRRVLAEGGYEGGTSMVYYGLPTSWDAEIENQIDDHVRKLLLRQQ